MPTNYIAAIARTDTFGIDFEDWQVIEEIGEFDTYQEAHTALRDVNDPAIDTTDTYRVIWLPEDEEGLGGYWVTV